MEVRGGDAMTLTHMGVNTGWWQSFAASPLLLDDFEIMPLGPPPADEPEEEEEEADTADPDHDGPGGAGARAASARRTVNEKR